MLDELLLNDLAELLRKVVSQSNAQTECKALQNIQLKRRLTPHAARFTTTSSLSEPFQCCFEILLSLSHPP